MSELTFDEFFKQKCDGTLTYPTQEEYDSFPDKGRKSNGFGTYKNIESFKKVYNKYIKGKTFLPADDMPSMKNAEQRRFGFIVNREGEADLVRIREVSIIEYLNGSK